MHAATVQNHRPVADILHVRQQVTRQDDRLAALGERENQILDFAAADRVEPGGRLVEDDQVGVVDERLRQADAALHALREFADVTPPGVVQPDHLDQLLGALAAFL